MKRFILAAALLAVALFASAQVVLYEDTAVFEWDWEGADTLPGDVVSFDVYIYDYLNPVIDNQDVGALTFIGTTTENTLTFDFPERKEWAVGVRSTLTDGGGVSGDPSIIAWSIDEGSVDVVVMGGPFHYVPLIPSGNLISPDNLRDQRY